MPHINIEAVDTDGAIREAAEAVAGDTRLAFLKKAGLAGGAALSGGTLLGLLAPAARAQTAGAGRPPASFGAGDIGILNYALTLEYLEAAFYNEAHRKGAVRSPEAKRFLKVVRDDENAHVAFLVKALGKDAVKKPKFDFQGTTSSEKKFLATAEVLENTGVGAYAGQGLNIAEPAYVAAALSILTTEARHSGALAIINGTKITPDGNFDKPLTADEVLAAVKSTGFIVG